MGKKEKQLVEAKPNKEEKKEKGLKLQSKKFFINKERLAKEKGEKKGKKIWTMHYHS